MGIKLKSGMGFTCLICGKDLGEDPGYSIGIRRNRLTDPQPPDGHRRVVSENHGAYVPHVCEGCVEDILENTYEEEEDGT